MCKLLIDICNPQTNVGVQILCDKISNTKSADFQHNILKMCNHIKSTMVLIKDMGETHNSLLKDTFDTILSVLNTKFTQFFVLKKTD